MLRPQLVMSPDVELYRSIVDHAPVMLLSTGVDGGCDHVNAAWIAFTGRAAVEELGTGWHDVIHADDRARFLGVFLHGIAGADGFEVECRLRGGDGVFRPIVLRGAPRPGPQGRIDGFVLSGAEVQHVASGSASGEADLFDVLIDHLCIAGFDGYWKRLNASWTRTLGWTTEELMSRPLIEFVHPDDREATLSARGRLKLGEPLLTLANRYRRKDGSYCWFEWRSVSDLDRKLVYAVARDVTAEHDSRILMRELTESLSATLNSIADGLVATDGMGAIARMNPVAEKLTGWSAGDALGRPIGEVFHVVVAGTHAAARFPIERTLQEGLAWAGAEHTILISRDGSELPIAFSRSPMRDAAGNVNGAVIVFRDMTDERNAREAQDQMQKQLMLAGRMASIGTLAAGVAHEINNPLAYVISNLRLMVEDLQKRDGGTSPRETAEWVGMLEEALHGADRIRKIVGGLKTFSRLEEERRAIIDVRPVLEKSIDMASNALRHRAQLVRQYGEPPFVEADASRLEQVFINILVNAAQAIPEGNTHGNEIRIVTGTDASGAAVIEVCDTGPGIAAHVIDRVFDPFFTTKPIGVGTGLGLSICHNIVSSMGGQISANNRDEGGAIFRITLPAASPPPATATAAAAAPAEIRPSTRRAVVLIVDDDRAVAAALRRVLRGHEVTLVNSGKEALDLISSGRSFDVILSDLMMPEMSGMELHENLFERDPGLAERMVFVTGGAFTNEAHAFLNRVPNECLQKPFETSDVRAVVERFASAAGS